MKRLYVLLFLSLWLGSTFAQIKRVSLQTPLARQYERVDVDIELIAKFQNPYLQEDAALDMLITTPSGKKLLLPCYYESGESGQISLWKARFAPQEFGNYQYSFQLSKGGKTKSVSGVAAFESKASGKQGFLHTKSDWVLQFDNGKPFRGVAENICWESRDHDDSKFFKQLHEMEDVYNYDYMLTDFARNGGNFYRTWICSWNLPFDYKAPFNNSRYAPSDAYYNPSALARMDYLIELSESLDLYIMLTLGQGGYDLRNGGVVNSSEEFFANRNARDRYKNRLRYIVARWGYSPSIAMWEFFNEVDNVQHRNRNHPIDGKLIVDWHDEMSTYIKQIDPYKHIVTTSISHRDVEGLNSIPNIDINQKHIYNNSSVFPAEINKYVNQFKKPYIIGEFGREWDWGKNFDDFSAEMDVDFRRGLWYGIFSPTPVLPMSWWWEYFDVRWMTPYFRGVREINDRMLIAGNGAFEPISVQAGNAHAFGVKCGDELYVYLFNPEHATLITDVSIGGKPVGAYRVQAFEPTTMLYREVSKLTCIDSSVRLHEVTLGSDKEIVYILTPANRPLTQRVGQTSTQAVQPQDIEAWITRADRSALFQQQPEKVSWGNEQGKGLPIIVDDRQAFQAMDGFGFAMTEGSAFHLNRMSAPARAQVLKEMFATDGNNVGFSYIRLTLGASDLNNFVYSYNDLPQGEKDTELKKFSLGHDHDDVIPVMKEVLKLVPNMKIMASPWSAPVWMKASNAVQGGALQKEYYAAYARYFVKYVQAMVQEGITIDAVTVQNEPLNSRNTPSMPWLWQEHNEFVRDHLGPAFKTAGLATKIVVFDHNCDRPDYPLAILSDPVTSQYVDGSAFHHYRGYLSGMGIVHRARPDKNIYFTEQMLTERPSSDMIHVAASVKRLVVDVARNWSKNSVLWNFAADPLNDPHTDNGGCSMCQGAITIDGDKVTRNIAYYTMAHVSKFVRPGSVRIASTDLFESGVDITEDEERFEVRRATVVTHSNVLPNVAFRTPEGRIVLIVANDTWSENSVKIQYNGRFANLKLAPGSVGTYIW